VIRRHPLLSLAMVAYLAALAWLTLTPSDNSDRVFTLLERFVREAQSHQSTDWITYDLVEFTANIALFVPMGVLVVLLFGRRLWWLGIFAGVLASVWIELAQLVWLPSRVSDPRDLVSNSMGTLIGVLFALVVTWPRAYRDRRDRRAMAAAHAAGRVRPVSSGSGRP
jgi:glycopeptide antibiotics resistance protein